MNGVGTNWICLRESINKREFTVSQDADLDANLAVQNLMESWPVKSPSVKKPAIPPDISLRFVVAADPISVGLRLELQYLPGASNKLNSDPRFASTKCPTVLITSLPLRTKFFKEKNLVGPKPSFFVEGSREIFYEILSESNTALKAGKLSPKLTF